MRHVSSNADADVGAVKVLASRIRSHLSQIIRQNLPITYQALAKAMNLSPPNTIQQLTTALECLIEEDAAAARPLIATFVSSKTKGKFPALGFFDCARRVGYFDGDPTGFDASTFYAAEFDKAVEYWCAVTDARMVPKTRSRS